MFNATRIKNFVNDACNKSINKTTEIAFNSLKGLIEITHIREEVERHFYALKVSLIFLIPIFLIIWIASVFKNILIFSLVNVGLLVYVFSCFAPDIFSTMLLSKKKEKYRALPHSFSSLILYSFAFCLIGWIGFLNSEGILLGGFAFLGYGLHLFVDSGERFFKVLEELFK